MNVLASSIFLQQDKKKATFNWIAFKASGVQLTLLEDVLTYSNSYFQEHHSLPSIQKLRIDFDYLEPLQDLSESLVLKDDEFLEYLKSYQKNQRESLFVQSLPNISSLAREKGIDAALEAIYAVAKPLQTSKPVMTLASDSTVIRYKERQTKSLGPLFFIRELDEATNGMARGSLTVWAAYAGHLKSQNAYGAAYRNSILQGYNTVFYTQEVSKQDVSDIITVIHTSHEKFQDYGYNVTLEKFFQGSLTDEELALLQEAENDLKSNQEYGKLYIIDPQDLEGTVLIGSFKSYLLYLDHLCGGLDFFIVDYLQLLGNSYGPNKDSIENMNYWCFEFKQLSLYFKTCSGEQGLSTLLLAQVNRDGLKEAEDNETEGQYSLRALAYANELEKSADRVIFSYYPDHYQSENKVGLSMPKNRKGKRVPVFDTYMDWNIGLLGDIEHQEFSYEDMASLLEGV